MLMEFADVRVSRVLRTGSWNASLARRWQSSKLPSTSRAWTLPPSVVSCFSWSSLTRPEG